MLNFNKKYFAKWLPVEGEIKDGDKIILKSYWIIRAVEQVFTCRPSNQFSLGDDFMKVKLFLCTGHIHIGDKFKSEMYPGEEYISIEKPEVKADQVYPLKCYYSRNGDWFQWIPYSEAYKVIGEISPHATWIKEGNEFHESDFEMWYWKDILDAGDFSHWFYTASEIDKEELMCDETKAALGLRIKPLARIKCPTCKTFH